MSTSSRVQILPCTAEDMPECMAVLSDSFGHDSAFIDMWYPAHETAAGQAQATSRLAAWFASGTSWFLKAVDTSSSPPRLIGLGVWARGRAPNDADKQGGSASEPCAVNFTPEDLKTAEPADHAAIWPDADERRFVQQIWHGLVQDRRVKVAEAGRDGCMVLEMLGVRRDGQRLGAGKALVTWGTDKADQLGIPAFLEATEQGAKTYVKCGFERMRIIPFPVDDDLKPGRRVPDLESMYRPKA